MRNRLDGTLNEKRIALVHRVIVPDKEYPKEYVILVTDKRSIFIQQQRTRHPFVLRGEMRYGTSLVTDVTPKTLEEYEHENLEFLSNGPENITVPHDKVASFTMNADKPMFRWRDLWVWLTMRRQGEIFQVYNFEIKYQNNSNLETVKFYAVPLGMYFKPRRQTQTRETILREYANNILETYHTVLPASIFISEESIEKS